MKFSIIHPTARVTGGFASPWWTAMDAAALGCEALSDVEYLLVVHHSRVRDFWKNFGHLIVAAPLWAWGRFQVVINHGRDCLVDQCNAGALAARGEIIVGNQDDMRFPEYWDAEIRKLLPDTSIPMCVQARTDGGRKDLLTIPTIATRVLVERIGLIPTDYESVFSDDEWSIKAWKFGAVIPSTLYFQHLHPANGTAAGDAVYDIENRDEAYKVGQEAFEKRKTLGFPRVPYPDEPSKLAQALRAAIDAPQYPTLAVCIPGDNFSFAWLEGFLHLGMQLKEAGYIVQRFMGHFSNVYHARMQLCERVIEDARITGEPPKYVLWLDSDNVVGPEQLMGLIKFLDHYQDVDGIAGWCWIRKPQGWTTSAGYFWEGDGVHLAHMNLDAMFAGDSNSEKFAPKVIEHTGFPCFLMRYSALEKLGPGAFRPLTKADLPAYFEGNMPEKEVTADWFCGEDTAWCLAAKKAGLRLVVDPGCKVAHLKMQAQEPITMKFDKATENAEAERSMAINGPPVVAPDEYARVGS